MTLLLSCWPCGSVREDQEDDDLMALRLELELENIRSRPPSKSLCSKLCNHGSIYTLRAYINRGSEDENDKIKVSLVFDKLACFINGNEQVEVYQSERDQLDSILMAMQHIQISKLECVHLLRVLEKGGMNMYARDLLRDTPLIKAIKSRNYVAVDALLQRSCDINATDRHSSTSLIYAAQYNEDDIVRSILCLHSGRVNLDKADYANHTALAYAATNNNIKVCTMLLDAGARTDVSSTSPLFLAVSNNASHQLVSLLISRGASVNVSNDEGLSAVAAAARNNNPAIISLLMENGASFDPTWFKNMAFTIGLSMDYPKTLEIFMDKGVDVLSPNHRGHSVIHEACCQGSTQFLAYAISKTNVNLDVRNRQGRTGAHLAAQFGRASCLETLFRAGADCWSADLRGDSALEIALFHNKSDCVLFFTQFPVFTRQRMFSIQHMLLNDYDQDALSRKPAVGLFTSRLQDEWGENNQVDTLFATCNIAIRRLLGQRPNEKVQHLPLPETLKHRITSFL